MGRPLLLTHLVSEAGLGCCHLAAENNASVTVCVHVCFYCVGCVGNVGILCFEMDAPVSFLVSVHLVSDSISSYCHDGFKINFTTLWFLQLHEPCESSPTNPEFMHCLQVYREVKDVGIPGYVKKQDRNG